MADVSISYKDETIAELDSTGSKTLKTGGCYCEGDIEVAYAPRSWAYEITLAETTEVTLLVTLDDAVREHINDPSMTVSLIKMDEFVLESPSRRAIFVTNVSLGLQNSKYPVYGCGFRQGSETAINFSHVYHPANNTNQSLPLGGFGGFYVLDGQYYMKCYGETMLSGTYRLVFAW